jgi:hypothetical protein
VRKKRLLALAGPVVVAAIAAILFGPSREPAWGGKTLRTWTHIYGRSFVDHPDSAETKQAADAISAMGDKALPFLLSWLPHEEKPWHRRLSKAVHNAPSSGALSSFIDGSEWRAFDAEIAFAAFGPRASNAVPALIKLLVKADAPETSFRAHSALSRIGEPAFFPVLEVLENRNMTNRDLAAYALANMRALRPQTAAAAISPLLALLGDSDTNLADSAANALGALAVQPSQVVPALTAELKNGSAMVRLRAAQALGYFGKSATSALPALLSLRNDTDKGVRNMAVEVISRISPTNFPAQ